jgi:hypothetical protein
VPRQFRLLHQGFEPAKKGGSRKANAATRQTDKRHAPLRHKMEYGAGREMKEFSDLRDRKEAVGVISQHIVSSLIWCDHHRPHTSFGGTGRSKSNSIANSWSARTSFRR